MQGKTGRKKPAQGRLSRGFRIHAKAYRNSWMVPKTGTVSTQKYLDFMVIIRQGTTLYL